MQRGQRFSAGGGQDSSIGAGCRGAREAQAGHRPDSRPPQGPLRPGLRRQKPCRSAGEVRADQGPPLRPRPRAARPVEAGQHGGAVARGRGVHGEPPVGRALPDLGPPAPRLPGPDHLEQRHDEPPGPRGLVAAPHRGPRAAHHRAQGRRRLALLQRGPVGQRHRPRGQGRRRHLLSARCPPPRRRGPQTSPLHMALRQP
mmetsp:Transcript_20509/g.55989  ORF Transcript_20509/g.55989 Transcript_20509/m.55989 type:complete len:200 (-) Transcript_20509:247-846(-)